MYLHTKRVLSFAEGCQYTGYRPSYMYKLTSAGVIPFSKPNGKRIWFDREKLDDWLLSNKSTTASEIDSKADTYLAIHR